MAEYLYTKPELLEEGKAQDMWDVIKNPDLYKDAFDELVTGHATGEDYKSTLEDIGDEVEQKLPDWMISQARKKAKQVENSNDTMIKTIRSSDTIWGDILQRPNLKSMKRAFKHRGIEETEELATIALYLIDIQTRDHAGAAALAKEWIRDLGGAGPGRGSKLLGFGLAAFAIGASILVWLSGGTLAPAAIKGFGWAMAALGVVTTGSGVMGGEEKDIIKFIRETLGDDDLANRMEENFSPWLIQQIYWDYESYFLSEIISMGDVGLKVIDGLGPKPREYSMENFVAPTGFIEWYKSYDVKGDSVGKTDLDKGQKNA